MANVINLMYADYDREVAGTTQNLQDTLQDEEEEAALYIDRDPTVHDFLSRCLECFFTFKYFID